MKAFKASNRKQFGWLASSFSLRRSAPKLSGPTSAIKPVSWLGLQTSFRLPAWQARSGIGICSRHSGATVPDSHRVPWHLTATVAEKLPPLSKSNSVLHPKFFISRKICSHFITIVLLDKKIFFQKITGPRWIALTGKRYISQKSRYIRYIIVIAVRYKDNASLSSFPSV